LPALPQLTYKVGREKYFPLGLTDVVVILILIKVGNFLYDELSIFIQLMEMLYESICGYWLPSTNA